MSLSEIAPMQTDAYILPGYAERAMQHYYFYQFGYYSTLSGVVTFTAATVWAAAQVLYPDYNTNREFANQFILLSFLAVTGSTWWIHNSLFNETQKQQFFLKHVIESAVPHLPQPKIQDLSPAEKLLYKGNVLFLQAHNAAVKLTKQGTIFPDA